MGVGVVPDGGLLDGSTIQAGDVVLGIESSGLHSNGYSLARRALLPKLGLDDYVEELGCSLADALLEPVHIYVPQARALIDANIRVRAMAHITGDGLLNLRRVEAPVGFELTGLPAPPAIFELIERLGDIERAEMRTVFNMGIGFAVVVAEADAGKALELIRGTGLGAWPIGHALADPERRVRIAEEGLIGTSKHFVAE
jgi:phosphoribosylformylglycinamidine cyclo-ligase